MYDVASSAAAGLHTGVALLGTLSGPSLPPTVHPLFAWQAPRCDDSDVVVVVVVVDDVVVVVVVFVVVVVAAAVVIVVCVTHMRCKQNETVD